MGVSDPGPNPGAERRVLLYVFLLCLAPRLFALLWLPAPELTHYWGLASGLLSEHALRIDGVSTTYIEPLYPAFLAAARFLTGERLWLVMVLQSAIASLGGVLLYRLSVDLTGRQSVGWIAAILYACNPYLVRQSGSLMEISLATTLLIAAAWAFNRSLHGHHRGTAAAAGVLLGLAVLTRFSFAPIFITACVLLIWRRRVPQAAALACAAGLCVGPWLLRSYAVDGSLAPTRIGENLFVSTCEYADQVVPHINVDVLSPRAYAAAARHLEALELPPIEWQRAADAWLLRRALDCILANPRRAAGMKLANALHTLSPRLLPYDQKPAGAVARFEADQVHVQGLTPRPRAATAVHVAAQSVLLVCALAGLALRRVATAGDSFLLCVAGAVIAVNTTFFPTTRLLAPMWFVLMFYAACALALGMDRLAVRRPAAWRAPN
ncbi:MAG: glycosyltransferase family 39 protein [Acidobacteria bacterium]|nr:glycosyltransferase family 39 protein [Acidobacteriota bacterium]MCA1651599.1 glycosyltransferase family 39 protein [Acidobacteriota bacterium]